MNITIKKTTDTICSCNNCGARNYEPTRPYKDNNRRVDTIFDVHIGCMVNTLCPDCLAELIGKATVALVSDK